MTEKPGGFRALADVHPLTELLGPRDPPEVIDASFDPAVYEPHGPHVRSDCAARDPIWLTSGDWRIFARPDGSSRRDGTEITSFTDPSGRRLAATWDDRSGSAYVPFGLADAFWNYVSEDWRAGSRRRGLSERELAVYYGVKRLIPRRAQLAARRALMRRQGEPEFPRWPLDRSVERLLHFHTRCLALVQGDYELRFRWFWPRPYRSALILTHDIESVDGLRLAPTLADLEEERGVRSSFNIVIRWYPIDHGIVRELQSRGFEIGIHGVYHDRSMFSSRGAFDRQLPLVEEAATSFGAVGFRSPATHRVFEWLSELPTTYDCTMPHSDPYEPQPGGCCSLWPFFIGDIVELPYTLPQDHTLMTLLGHRSSDLWVDLLERIHRSGGLAQVPTHPDPGYLGDTDKRAIYADFLDRATDEPERWHALPRDVASWWRQRAGRAPVDGAWEAFEATARVDPEGGAVALDPDSSPARPANHRLDGG